jgi:hypothetical protein
VASELDRSLAIGLFSRMLARSTRYHPKPSCATPVDWAAGASMMLRRETIRAVGLLDETFFAYFEDMDYCLAAAREGWRTWYVPASRIVHIKGASSGIRAGPYASLRSIISRPADGISARTTACFTPRWRMPR